MTAKLPPNIAEFNEIVAVIFVQLYIEHPREKTLDANEVAQTLGRQVSDQLPSGRNFSDIFARTGGWLAHEGYIFPNGSHPRERVQFVVAQTVGPQTLT